MFARPAAAPAVAFAALLIAGCGYRPVGPESLPALRVGAIDDLTPDGDLGLLAAERLRKRLAPGAQARYEVRGLVRPADDRPAAIAVAAGERARIAAVEVELWLAGADGLPVVRSGPVVRSAPALFGADLAATHAARRRATRRALDEAVDDALDRLVAHAGDAP